MPEGLIIVILQMRKQASEGQKGVDGSLSTPHPPSILRSAVHTTGCFGNKSHSGLQAAPEKMAGAADLARRAPTRTALGLGRSGPPSPQGPSSALEQTPKARVSLQRPQFLQNGARCPQFSNAGVSRHPLAGARNLQPTQERGMAGLLPSTSLCGPPPSPGRYPEIATASQQSPRVTCFPEAVILVFRARYHRHSHIGARHRGLGRRRGHETLKRRDRHAVARAGRKVEGAGVARGPEEWSREDGRNLRTGQPDPAHQARSPAPTITPPPPVIRPRPSHNQNPAPPAVRPRPQPSPTLSVELLALSRPRHPQAAGREAQVWRLRQASRVEGQHSLGPRLPCSIPIPPLLPLATCGWASSASAWAKSETRAF